MSTSIRFVLAMARSDSSQCTAVHCSDSECICSVILYACIMPWHGKADLLLLRYGERCSGTTWVNALLAANFHIEIDEAACPNK